jgi:acyl-coenzyme A thioesterase PaaI-like protein
VERAGPDDHLFAVDDDVLVPTLLCQGPWSPDAMHGSAVAAVVARAVEAVPTPVPMRPARLTLDMLRPVPLRPLRLDTAVVKAGGRIAVIAVDVLDGDTVVTRASALLVRDGRDFDFGPVRRPPEPAPPPTEPIDAGFEMPSGRIPGFVRAVDLDRTRGRLGEPGPASAWSRLRCPVVAGEPVSAFQRLAVAADMGSGIGGFLDYARWTTINADLTLHVLRLPVGERIGVDGLTRADEGGVGQSQADLFDTSGRCGGMQASIVVDTWR